MQRIVRVSHLFFLSVGVSASIIIGDCEQDDTTRPVRGNIASAMDVKLLGVFVSHDVRIVRCSLFSCHSE